MAEAGQLPSVLRNPAQTGREYSEKDAKLVTLPPAHRISLRAPAGSVAALSKALGLPLPEKPKTSVSKDGRSALWLGPDEWLVIDDAVSPVAALEAVEVLHSAVDVSHRNVAFALTGPGAADIMNCGCPQDLSLAAFPVGACSRTILGKVEIILLRTSEEGFRVECWRSFSDYVFAFLSKAARDASA